MKGYNLNIAGYNIRFESEINGPELIPSERFTGFLCFENNPDVIIRVHSGNLTIPCNAELVFNAPYIEERNEIRLKKNDEFWSVYKCNNDLFIKTIFPHAVEKKEAILKYSLTETNWDLWFSDPSEGIDPMAYPLDGLILYYLTVINGDIMVHASGAYHNGHGYLFSGISGKGKTTMARLWNSQGAKIIHDDRLIVRRGSKGYSMFNTPVYKNEEPNECRLDKIFIIEHGLRNEITPVSGAESVSLLMANCIQHNWDSKMIGRQLESVATMTEEIPVAKLFFHPDNNVVDFILKDEKQQS